MTQYVKQTLLHNPFATTSHSEFLPTYKTPLSSPQLEINLYALSPIFFLGENLCGFYVRDSSILGEYVTLSVKLYILARLCAIQQLIQQKTGGGTNTLYFGRGGADPTNMDFHFLKFRHPVTHSLTHSPLTLF